MKRRMFLQGAVALAAAPAVPAKALVQGPAGTATLEAVVAPLREPRASWWGYSTGDGFFHEAGRTREEVIRHLIAEGYRGERVEIALCHPKECSMPNYLEDIVNWLADDSTWGLADMLCEKFCGYNSDADYEGEVADEAGYFDWNALAASVLPLISAAFERNGIFIGGEIEAGCLADADEATLRSIEQDGVFGRDLKAVSEAWADKGEIRDIGRSIDTTDSQKVYVPGTVRKLAAYAPSVAPTLWHSPTFQDHPRW